MKTKGCKIALTLKMIFLAFLLMTAASCCATSGGAGMKPIRPLDADMRMISDDLVNQILEHNETGERNGWW